MQQRGVIVISDYRIGASPRVVLRLSTGGALSRAAVNATRTFSPLREPREFVWEWGHCSGRERKLIHKEDSSLLSLL